MERPSNPVWGSGCHQGPPAAAHSPAVKDHSNNNPFRLAGGVGAPSPHAAVSLRPLEVRALMRPAQTPKEGGKPAEGQTQADTVWRRSPERRGEPPQASAGAAQPRTFRSGQRSAEPPGGGCGVAGSSGTGRAQRRRCFPVEPLGGQ